MALTKEDLQAIGALLEPIHKRLDALEEGQQSIRKSQLKVELEQYPRIAAALDGFQSNKDKNQEQDERMTAIEKKADYHEIRFHELETQIKKAL